MISQDSQLKIQPYRYGLLKTISLLETVIIIVTTIVFFIALYIDNSKANFDWLGAILPTVPAISVWLMKRKENWLKEIPTYLNITLKDPNGSVAFFELIPIQKNTDIRQQAQTVLSAIASKGRVDKLETFVRSSNLKEGIDQIKIDQTEHIDPDKRIAGGKPFELKEVTLHTTAPVAKNQKETEEPNPKHSVYVSENKIWFWRPIDHFNTHNEKPEQVDKSKLPELAATYFNVSENKSSS